MVVFYYPEGTILDKQMFSKDMADIQPEWHDLTVGEKDNATGKKLHGMVISWRIGIVGGRRVEVNNAKPDIKSFHRK
jgi:hypothetical protein